MGFLQKLNEALQKYESRRATLDRIKEDIEALSDEDWNELLGWMENKLEDVETADPGSESCQGGTGLWY